jgi:hypothetical protein
VAQDKVIVMEAPQSNSTTTDVYLLPSRESERFLVARTGANMPKETHTKAAEHHENAAKAHRTAAEHHGKGEHDKGHEESTKAHEHSTQAHRHSTDAHGKSGEHRTKK